MRCWCRHGNDRGDLFPWGLLRPDLDCIPSILGWVIAPPTQLPDLDLTVPPLEQDVLVQWLMDIPQSATQLYLCIYSRSTPGCQNPGVNIIILLLDLAINCKRHLPHHRSFSLPSGGPECGPSCTVPRTATWTCCLLLYGPLKARRVPCHTVNKPGMEYASSQHVPIRYFVFFFMDMAVKGPVTCPLLGHAGLRPWTPERVMYVAGPESSQSLSPIPKISKYSPCLASLIWLAGCH